jgi:Gas vesicle synthesis protein GvpL/GvpF
VIYVYAITEPPAEPCSPQPGGFNGAQLRFLVDDGIAAVYSRHRSLRIRESPEDLWSHEAVVRRLMARGAVLPLRFGTLLAGEGDLRRSLAERHGELVRGLERVRGRVELSVRVLGREGPEPAPGQVGGREYLLGRRAALQRAERAAGEVHEPLAALAREARLRAPATPPAIFAAAYLVDRGGVDEFKDRVRALAAARHDLSIVGTGPWPPYTFVTEPGL